MNEPGPLHPVAASLEPLRGGLASYPPPERWDDWKEYDPARWPKRVEKHYTLIPTICFNCEAGCGLLAYVDREKLDIHKFEGNPVHPGSRGRNCAKGPATINQVKDPERILYPFWHGLDRPSPDHANARFILLLSSHLETGHYFNPHAQRIIDGKERGAKICVIDTRLSNTASMADYWLAPWPGTEAALLLAMCHVILKEDLYDADFLRKWVNWEEYLREVHPDKPRDFETFLEMIKQVYADFTPEFGARESGVDARTIVEVAREIGRA